MGGVEGKGLTVSPTTLRAPKPSFCGFSTSIMAKDGHRKHARTLKSLAAATTQDMSMKAFPAPVANNSSNGACGSASTTTLEFNFEVQHPADGGRLPPVF
jgi:hypothetical protein